MDPKNELVALKSRIAELENKLNQNKEFADEQRRIENEPLHILYAWTAPDRINVRKTAKWFNTLLAVIIGSIIFAVLTENYLLILVVLSLGFFVYASTSTPPKIQQLAVTNKGMKINDKVYYWGDIDFFWVSERSNNLIINIELKEYKGRLTLLQGAGDINKIVSEMGKHEDYREPTGPLSFINTLTEGKGKNLADFSKKRDDII